MAYLYEKAVCLFCDATIEGNQRYMLGGKTLPSKRGSPPKWLKERAEHLWIWNGLDNAIFYLCPEHQSDEDYKNAFEWAEKYGIEEGVIFGN